MKNRKNKFFQLPQIVGGKEALNKYIDANLIYPKEALTKRIEGIVYLKAEIDDNGKVVKVEILKGLAGGCNEEAVRLIENVRFGQVRNKSVRLKTKKRFKIKFQLPSEKRINYDLVSAKEKQTNTTKSKSYSYTIIIQ